MKTCTKFVLSRVNVVKLLISSIKVSSIYYSICHSSFIERCQNSGSAGDLFNWNEVATEAD